MTATRLHNLDPAGIVDAVDRAGGRTLERLIVTHHQRRLRRQGWQRILEDDLPGFTVAGDPPPRPGNRVEVLVDGASAFLSIQRAMRQATSHVHLANWFLSPDFRLEPDGPTVGELLAELARRVDVRVLLWAGPPMPWSSFGRPDIQAVRDRLCHGTRVQCLLDAHERPLHTHHEKIVVIDDRVAYVGGLDYTAALGDRLDSSLHPYRNGVGWHDMSARVDGPAASDVAAHFRLRWEAVSGTRMPPIQAAPAAGHHRVQVLATFPETAYPAMPRGSFRILEAYRRALSQAKRLIYVENQFLWSPEVTAVLCTKLLDPPTADFRMLLLLPARAADGADDTRGQLATLIEADRDHRLLAATIHSRAGAHSQPIYVHAKLAVVDDAWLTVGSANLNDHSLFNDTELNLAVYDADVARTTRERLWAEHLEMSLEEVSAADPTTLIDEVWRPVAEEQLERRRRGDPMTHRLARLPHLSRRTDRLLGALQELVLDG
jgi:phosphatidylserine/phosphatidylglycerophosphate/cardiolipin synthase-like enzyme